MLALVHLEDPVPAGLFGFEALRSERWARADSHVHAGFSRRSPLCAFPAKPTESHGFNKLWSRLAMYNGVAGALVSFQFQGIEYKWEWERVTPLSLQLLWFLVQTF